MRHKNFRFSGKRKSPDIYFEVVIDSDRFDGNPDRNIVYVTAGNNCKRMVFGID